MCDVFVDQIHVARRAEEKAEADAAARSAEARSLSEQLTAAQSALATAEESAARSTALAQRHLEALRTLPILPQVPSRMHQQTPALQAWLRAHPLQLVGL